MLYPSATLTKIKTFLFFYKSVCLYITEYDAFSAKYIPLPHIPSCANVLSNASLWASKINFGSVSPVPCHNSLTFSNGW